MKRSDIPSLDDLRAFETVARLGSMRAAADELALTHGAISRRVAKLSRDLGITLVTPEGRGIALTPDGDLLAQATQQGLSVIGEALSSIRDKEGDAPIVLSCERSVAMRWLIPRLSQFQDAHPHIPVHLSVGGGSLNFAKDGVTLAIRRLDFAIDPAWHVQTLLHEEIGAVMAPEMSATFRSGDYIGLGSKTRPDAWTTWMNMHPDSPRPKDIRLFDHHFLLAEAAASGLGVAICPRIVVSDDINKDRLVAPYGFVADSSTYGLIFPAKPGLSDSEKKLLGWIESVFLTISNVEVDVLE
ncbi:LysR family transcriptional regulator [Parasedimentitalea huanghaiensis]|uniref:LysR family transcriptional regulator n=1 Tax=Parasedimentitalea huanghaiensis TaxID=2682100 RepID=A0A6L6WKH6_9RHOB|nr:LysR family transcriptional regulator [Zongyanglinia huanghaiensis]MVO17095.1 LysR family transcriptional regulator [Zongyanglinia huanghaiensis]